LVSGDAAVTESRRPSQQATTARGAGIQQPSSWSGDS
jgi:hypothetical protein